MRHIMFDKYHTWYDWQLTLTAKNVAPATPKTNYITLDGANGSLDLSEALAGEAVYNDRTVTASFWTSEGTHEERLAVLRDILTALHGKKVQIVDPDDPEHYFLGRVVVKSTAWDAVHLEFTVEAICDPWRYAMEETARRVEVAGDTVDVVLHNNGAKTLCPVIAVSGTVAVTANGVTSNLTSGAYKLPDIRLAHGATVINVSGTGSVTFHYREAEL